MKYRTFLLLISLFFLNFQCKKEGVYFLVENNTNESFYVFSKDEFEYYKDGFLSKQILSERKILEKDSNYIILQEFELKNFEDSENVITFYFCYDKKKYENFKIDRDKIELETINKIIHNYGINEFYNTKIKN